MLGNAAPTPFDLRFTLFGIPVRVHPFFWLFSALMGWDPDDPNHMLLWVVCVFVSILVHEFGHALMAQYFGWPPHVVLYSFGGYAAFQPTWGYTTWRAVLVSFAGPAAGFILFAFVLAAHIGLTLLDMAPKQEPQLGYFHSLFFNLELINLGWGLVNLLPVLPLDGGQISRTILSHYRPRDGVDIALKISIVFAAGAAYLFFMIGQKYAGILFAVLGIESFMALQAGRSFR